MKQLQLFLLTPLSLLAISCSADIGALPTPSPQKLQSIYCHLDPTSINQHLAFYELYPQTEYGRRALQDLSNLLSGNLTESSDLYSPLPFQPDLINVLSLLVNRAPTQDLPSLSDATLTALEKVTSKLNIKQIKGHHALTELELQELDPDEIDLARAIFVIQFGSDLKKIRTYESIIDLIALQVQARLPTSPSAEQTIREINKVIFDEMRFRFPPKSLQFDEIDTYTLLPAVLDSHRGVCLGVSILYLSVAQRLNLPLEMITPPGHIYVRHRSGDKVINIETTARGIHIDSEDYLSINTHSLQQRNIKEVIGLAHCNEASVFWNTQEYEQAYQAYLKAAPYLKNDPFHKELFGYSCILTGRSALGKQLLGEIADDIPEHALTKNNVAEDYLLGHVDEEGIKTLFLHPNEDRASLLHKKDQLEAMVQRHPKFRAGLFALGGIWLELHRTSEALEAFQKYHLLEPHDPEANYFLVGLYTERMDYLRAWSHMRTLEQFLQSKGVQPKKFIEMKRELLLRCPDYQGVSL